MFVAFDISALLGASLLLALVGLVFLWSGGRELRRQRNATIRAEQASGTVENVGIQKIQDGPRATYVPAVEYEYQTPTQRLHGSTFYPGDSQYTKLFHSESAAENAVEEYEPGDPTTVYYDTANPDHSFLEPTPHRGPNVTKVGFGLGLIVLAGVIAVQSGII